MMMQTRSFVNRIPAALRPVHKSSYESKDVEEELPLLALVDAIPTYDSL
jgi:hypothetical protein